MRQAFCAGLPHPICRGKREPVRRAKALGKDYPLKREVNEDTRRAMFPSNYPDIAM